MTNNNLLASGTPNENRPTGPVKVGADLSEDPHLEALSEETQPERLIEQIEARENNS